MNFKYNSQLPELILPEYGRNINNMVAFCTGLEDKEERTKCAYSIIEIMGDMFPHLRDINDFKHLLWDHLAIMSNFELDIDYPYSIVKKEELYSKPDPIPYSQSRMRFKHYGKNLERMIKLAIDMQEGEEKEQLILLVATHMKKSYIQWNKEVDDQKIFIDLLELSKGKINLTESNIKLPEMKDISPRNNNNNNNNNNGRKRRK